MYENLLANVPTDLWIGGQWRKASDGGRFDVIDPATENKIASVASAEAEFIPPWIMGNGPPGAPVYGVVTPPGAHPWVGPTIPFLGTPIPIQIEPFEPGLAPALTPSGFGEVSRPLGWESLKSASSRRPSTRATWPTAPPAASSLIPLSKTLSGRSKRGTAARRPFQLGPFRGLMALRSPTT